MQSKEDVCKSSNQTLVANAKCVFQSVPIVPCGLHDLSVADGNIDEVKSSTFPLYHLLESMPGKKNNHVVSIFYSYKISDHSCINSILCSASNHFFFCPLHQWTLVKLKEFV